MKEKVNLENKGNAKEAIKHIRQSNVTDDDNELILESNDKRIQPYYKFSLMKQHIYQAIKFLEFYCNFDKPQGSNAGEALNNETSYLKFALFFSSMVTYMKPFIKGSGVMSDTLQFNSISKAEKHRILHAEIAELRHSYLAHSGESGYQEMKIIFKVKFNQPGYADISLHPEIVYQYGLSTDKAKEMLDLQRLVYQYLTKQCQITSSSYLNSLTDKEKNTLIKKLVESKTNYKF